MLEGTYVEMPAMLDAREQRAALQREFLESYHCPLLSFCLNIPGPVKTNASLRALFDDGLTQILQILTKPQWHIVGRHDKHKATGDECLLAIQGDVEALKEAMVKLEEQHPLGRLFDIDVLNDRGEKLSRSMPRRCLLCGRQAQDCARSRRHSVEELTDYIASLLRQYHYEK